MTKTKIEKFEFFAASGVPVEANGPALSTASIEQGLKSILLGSNAVTDVKPQLEGAELLRHLRHQLEYYFSKYECNDSLSS